MNSKKKRKLSLVPKDTSLNQIRFPHLKPIEQTIIKAFIDDPDDANTDYFLKVIETQYSILKFLKYSTDASDEIQICKDTVHTLNMLYEYKRPDHHVIGCVVH